VEAFLAAIVTWLSANTDLPANYNLPHIRYASPTEISDVRYGAFRQIRKQNVVVSQTTLGTSARNSVISVYNPEKQEILLPIGWKAVSAAEQSVLVHEMVHHLQYSAQVKFNCPQELEAAAYRAQEKWLQLFEKSLEREFGLDGFTILVKSNCL
jgi:uncharacterized protein DUF6647